jgi:hypothetical protein
MRAECCPVALLDGAQRDHTSVPASILFLLDDRKRFAIQET